MTLLGGEVAFAQAWAGVWLGVVARCRRRGGPAPALGPLPEVRAGGCCRGAAGQHPGLDAHCQRSKRLVARPLEGSPAEPSLGAIVVGDALQRLPTGKREGGIRFVLIDAAQRQDTGLVATR
jgi:hypothetical protein